MVKKGNDAIKQVCATIGRVLNNTTTGKKFLAKNPHIDQKLAYFICKDLRLICGYVEGGSGCTRTPRAKGLCMKHWQRKYIKYVSEDNDNKGKDDKQEIKVINRKIQPKRLA